VNSFAPFSLCRGVYRSVGRFLFCAYFILSMENPREW
jgi:hypothetical protein